MENDNNLSEEILTNIKEHKITPRPKWQFIFKSYFVWTVGFLALFFGAISISLIIFMLRYNEWSSYRHIGAGPLEFLLLVVPIFWIICLLIFVVLIYFNFKQTKHGYRYKPLFIVASAVALSVILGYGFFSLGLGQKIDAILGRRAPLYDSVINPRLRFWSNPAAGRLSGLIVSQESDSNYILVDDNNVEWRVNYIEANDEKLLEAKKAGVSDDDTSIAVGRPARFLGEKTGDKEFKAKELVSFHPGREFFYRFENGHLPRPNSSTPEQADKNKLSDDSTNSALVSPDIANPESDPSGMMPPAILDQKINPKADGQKLEFYTLLEKYPEFKAAFSKDLLTHKEMIKPILKKDPDFLKNLEALKIDPAVLKELNK